MTGKEIMITTLRRSTIALLASSLLLTIGRGATLPFMTIYLTRRFQLEVDVIGYALSLALVVGVLFSMGFGILADRFDKKRYMVWSVLVFILGFSAIPLVNNALLVVIFFALINCAYSVFSTVLALVRRSADGREKSAHLLAELHHPQHRLDRWAAHRHPAGNAQYQFAVLAGGRLRRLSAGVYSAVSSAG